MKLSSIGQAPIFSTAALPISKDGAPGSGMATNTMGMAAGFLKAVSEGRAKCDFRPPSVTMEQCLAHVSRGAARQRALVPTTVPPTPSPLVPTTVPPTPSGAGPGGLQDRRAQAARKLATLPNEVVTALYVAYTQQINPPGIDEELRDINLMGDLIEAEARKRGLPAVEGAQRTRAANEIATRFTDAQLQIAYAAYLKDGMTTDSALLNAEVPGTKTNLKSIIAYADLISDELLRRGLPIPAAPTASSSDAMTGRSLIPVGTREQFQQQNPIQQVATGSATSTAAPTAAAPAGLSRNTMLAIAAVAAVGGYLYFRRR